MESQTALLEAPLDLSDLSCFCGIPNCHGHEMIDGEIHIPNHPLGYLVGSYFSKDRDRT